MITAHALSLLGIGLLMLAIGLWPLTQGTWRTGIPAAELLVSRLTGRDPGPRTVWDRRFALFNACASVALGSLLIFGGVLVALIASAE